MQNYKSKTMQKRVKKTHSKAKFAGVFYMLGALALAVLAFFPILVIGGKELWVGNFFEPFMTITADTKDWFGIIVASLYSILLLTVVINFFKCLANMSWLTKRSSRYVNGYNRNVRAMDKIGKSFSSSFAALIILLLEIYVLHPTTTEITFTMWAYVALGAGAFVHFLSGLVGGKVSYFELDGVGGNVEEEKRSCGLFVYFFRNLVQIAAVAGILYFFVPHNAIAEIVSTALAGGNPIEGKDMVYEVIPMGLQILILLCSFVLIKHATAATEFNRNGIEGKGMLNFRVFSLFVALFAGGVFALQYIQNQTEFKVDYIIIAGIALLAFLVDCIFKSRPKTEEKDEVEEDEDMYNPCPQQMPAPAPAPMQQNAQMPYQPIYVPIYYYPYGGEMPVATTTETRPAPAPAPAHLQNLPAPDVTGKNELRNDRRDLKDRNKMVKRGWKEAKVNVRMQKKNDKNAKKTEKKDQAEAAKMLKYYQKHGYPRPDIQPKSREEELAELNPYKQYAVRCPVCGKILNVKDTTPYHRCPECGKVFTIRKFQTYVKKDEK